MDKKYNYITVYIGTDSYIFRTTKKKYEIIDGDLDDGIPTEDFLKWFDNETNNFYDADSLGEMVVTYYTGDYIIEY